jgi:hypothetical protein
MIVRVRPDRVPDACPETLVTVIVPVAEVVLMAEVVLLTVAVIVTVVVARVVVVVVTVTGPVAWLVARLVRVVAVLAAHDPSMTRKTRCSISTSASRRRLRIARNCGAGG